MIQSAISNEGPSDMSKKTKPSKAKKKVEPPKEDHGGRRVGSGKPSWFRGKSASSADPMYKGVRNSASVRLTEKGWTIMDGRVATLTAQAESSGKLPVSQATIVETLLRLYGPRLTLADVERAAGMK